ncbi:MAG: fatty acid hydroxylase [Gemmatimonadetes bacterium]|nr:fatty acid hydroxylase [Gemmatimonadota bacterium]NIO30947.1 fatty acid hydroxylase [Gemmatimonadota bacterium]
MARKYVSNKDESVRIFRNGFLERFTYVHPIVPHVIHIPVIAFVLYLSYAAGVGVSRIGLLFAGGLALWTLAEYVVHRFVFHSSPELEEEVHEIVSGLEPGGAVMPKLTGFRQRHYFLVHGVHHDFPNDSKRLVMPPSVSIPLAVVFFAAFRLAFGPGAGAALFGGFAAGYLTYDTIHYAVHHFSLRNPVMLYLKKKHFRHHYQESRRDFGVSSPLWDWILRTD